MQEGGWRHITDTNCTQPLHLLRGTRVTLQPINIQLWSTDTPLRFISPILCPLFIACWLSATPFPPPLQHHSSISAVLFFFLPYTNHLWPRKCRLSQIGFQNKASCTRLSATRPPSHILLKALWA